MEKPFLAHKESVFSCFLPKEVVIKILACADLEAKKILRLTCSEILAFNTHNFVHHSPLILSRKEHLYYMVYTAQKNYKTVFYNLFWNAAQCDHADILDTVCYFLPEQSCELELLKTYSTSCDASLLEQLLPYIMEVYKGENDIYDRYKNKNIYYSENEEGMSPLSTAIYHYHPKGVLELLLAQNIDLLNQTAIDGWTPLHDAVYVDDLEMCTLLLSFKEIKKDILDDDGNTALHLAAINNRIPIVKILLESGVGVDILNLRKQTPLWCAACFGHAELVELLLKYNADVEIVSTDIEVPYSDFNVLSIAILNGCVPIVRLLLESGANPNTQSVADGSTPLLFATTSDNYDLVELLLKKGACIDAADCDGYTSLMRTVEKGNIAIAQLLLTYNANIYYQANDECTALQVALKNNNKEMIMLLFKQSILFMSKVEKEYIFDKVRHKEENS